MPAPSRFGLDCFQSNIRKHVSFCRSPRCTWELSHTCRNTSRDPFGGECFPSPEAAAASGSRAGFPSPSSASYPALRFRRRVDATRMVFPLIRNDLLASFRKIAFCQLPRMVSPTCPAQTACPDEGAFEGHLIRESDRLGPCCTTAYPC